MSHEHYRRFRIVTYAGEGRPQDPSSFVNLRTEAGWKLRNRLDATHLVYAPPTPGSARGPASPASCCGPCPLRSMPQRPFYFCSGEYYVRLVDELRPLTYGLVGRKTKLMPKDVWATILGHWPFARRRGRVDPEHDPGLMKGTPMTSRTRTAQGKPSAILS